MVPPDSCRISPVPHYSGYHYLHIAYAYRTFTLFGAAFQAASTSLCFRYRDPTTPEHASMNWFRLLPVRSPLLGKSLLFSRSEEHTSELQSRGHLVCRLLLEKKKTTFII